MFLQAGIESGTPYVWDQAGTPGKAIIILLGLLSVFVWSVMLQKARQTRQARKLNRLFADEFHQHDGVLVIHNRDIHVEGCPLFNLYDNGCKDLLSRLKTNGNEGELGSEKYAYFSEPNSPSLPLVLSLLNRSLHPLSYKLKRGHPSTCMSRL